MTLSYIVSTAGHAQHQNEQYPHDVTSILQLILEGAEEFGEEKVVGFTSLSAEDGAWLCNRLSFAELLRLAGQMAQTLAERGIESNTAGSNIVSLLCPTGLDFLLGWIALMRLGYGVVFIAPQCSPSAIIHLVSSSSSTRLVYHPKYAELASAAQGDNPGTLTTELPSSTSDRLPSEQLLYLKNNAAPDSVSHIFHTSGTSGTPKPIPNTHGQSVSVLPRRALPSYLPTTSSSSTAAAGPSPEPAAFTTTPLFHGGVSDLLRAWMARSMIYFYPTSDVPITASHVAKAVGACQAEPPALEHLQLSEAQVAERRERFRVASFLSVPYILSTLVEDADSPAMAMLKDMSFVSTGGAPLDTGVGDQMVNSGVNLVSRLGSSECGFLLSSHRDYDTEKDWEWLRNDSSYAYALAFEPVDDANGRFEMVVTREWASMTKSNRDDGSYATGDLYSPHPTKQNVWRYAGRGDDVIVMSNGEKASPGPIETTLRASPHLSDALVVGSDRSQLGVLLFARPAAPVALMETLKPLLESANHSSPSFAQISTDMCTVISDRESWEALPKSSKGTIQRGLAYEVFKEEIARLYEGQSGEPVGLKKRTLAELQKDLFQIIKDVGSARLKLDGLKDSTDLFAWGVDSLMATRIRNALQKTFHTGGRRLPNNVVFERPSIQKLSHYLHALQENDEVEVDSQDAVKLMNDLVEKYGTFSHSDPSRAPTAAATDGKTILLTGGTGSLGAYLITQLSQLSSSVVSKIVCLVRAGDDQAAMMRIRKTLSQRQLNVDLARVQAYGADFSMTDLGLTSETYDALSGEVDSIVHAAWPVHFASSLVSFEDNIKGTRRLLDFLASVKSHTATFYYCSSLASVLAQPSAIIKEVPSDDPSTASPIGYSQSKWVTEKICRLASETRALKDRVKILRVGQLCGDMQDGYWNEKEGWPLMIRTAQTTGTLPVLQERPSWLPVDLAAQTILDVVLNGHIDQEALVYHIAHPEMIDWNVILDGLEAAGLDFQRVPPQIWIEKVEETSEDVEENPSKQMLTMWQQAYGNGEESEKQPIVDTDRACAASATLREIRPVDAEQIKRMVQAWRRSGFLH